MIYNLLKYIIPLYIVMIPSSCIAFDEWDDIEIAMETAFVALTVVDWGQTLDIADDRTYHEHNPILGNHPDRERVNAWFATSLVVQPLIAHVLPHSWRKAWIGSGIGLEIGCVGRNHRIGLKMNF